MPDKDTELFVFDVDDTLAPSKLPVTPAMVQTLLSLLSKRKVAAIGGGAFYVYEKQFAPLLETQSPDIKNFSIFPTCGAQYLKYDNGWQQVYRNDLSGEEKEKIVAAVKESMRESGVDFPKTLYGEQIEDRGSQVSISAIGQEAPIALKRTWDPDQEKRRIIKSVLDPLIPEFEVRIGGTTTIDITKKGIDKAYGVKMMEKHLGIPISKMFFIGDALYPGGNDEAVVSTGIRTHAVKNEEETRQFLETVIPLLD